MENLNQIFFEKEEHKFIVFFLYDDEDQNIQVEEVKEIDFPKVTQHLDFGGSVFITHRRNPKRNISSGRGSKKLKQFTWLRKPLKNLVVIVLRTKIKPRFLKRSRIKIMGCIHENSNESSRKTGKKRLERKVEKNVSYAVLPL